QIITQWPGRSTEEVEKFVTIPLEVEMNAIPGKTSLRSISLFGLSVVTIMFDDDVDEFKARQLVANRLISVQTPEGADPELQPSYGPTGEIFRYTLKSENLSARDLKTIQDWVVERNLKGVPGIADVVSFGGEVKTFEISVDPNLLQNYNITALDVFQAVSRSNVNVGGDVIEKNDQAYVVRGIGVLNNLYEIENIVIANINGTPILVSNVAHVQESALPKLGYVGRDSTQNQVEGIVVMLKNENPSVVLENLKAKIDELNEHILPRSVQIEPFYDRSVLIGFTTHTVMKNLLEGVILVTLIVLLFMADWRTTVIVAVVIPLALLFAFVCMRMKGMSANLLSMGAIDFGIITDGAVVMVEGLFVLLDERAHKLGMSKYNNLLKFGIIRKKAGQLGKAIFFSKLIIVTALLPIFAFQKVEGKMFSPLAYTLGFALLGALIFTLTLVPVLASYLLNKNVREKHNPIVNFFDRIVMAAFNVTFKHKAKSIFVSLGIVAFGLFSYTFLGTEFLPELNEGAIYIRASMPMSTSLSQSIDISERMRKSLLTFDEVKGVMSQSGRPNDGTDPTGFFNIEFHVDLKQANEWKRHISKEELISQMKAKLMEYQGISLNFSQPIMDNVEEAVSGVKGSLAVKVYGHDPQELEEKANQVYEQLRTVEGIEDLGVIQLIGQPEYHIDLDQQKMAIYGVSTADCQSVIQMAIGGKAITKLYEGERKFDVRIRYMPQYRMSREQLGNLVVPNMAGKKILLKEICTISKVTGPAFLYRENNERFVAIKFSVRGRDMGSTINEAQHKVKASVTLDKGMHMESRGQFENQVRATKRLGQVVPISLVLIFIILFIMFGNGKDAGLVLLNVPFALIGGIWALWITQTNFSISAGVGFIALFGICVQNGVILISVFKQKLQEGVELDEAIREGVKSRVRPVIMTALMAALGLLPAAISHGIGSETQKPLAIVVIGGIISSTILTLLVFPIICHVVYKHPSLRN
ncbi:MAG: efflux RND transporter permease subunit, partial [Cytophagales bacterium]|nr:efflux RND transporter permease subunit [Cytophaga sp.]